VSFDAVLQPEGLTDQDLCTLRAFGVRGALVVCAAPPRPTTASGLIAQLEQLVSVQLPRLEAAGLAGWAALGIPPGEVPERGLDAVLAVVPGLLRCGRAPAVGPLGLAEGSQAEEESLRRHLELAETFRLRVVACASHARDDTVVRLLLRRLRESRLEPARIVVQGLPPRMIAPTLALGFHAGLTLHPTSTSVEGAVGLVRRRGPRRLMLGSAGGSGGADFLALPRAEHLLRRAGLSRTVVARATERNATAFLGVRVE
jgi:predicted metal-dependent TIM-barrel fold hydrolase